MLIINADDWGRSRGETDAALACFKAGRLTSVSAMVFMEDSERAAKIAGDAGIEVGLHLNLTEDFSASSAGTDLERSLRRVSRFLKSASVAHLVYHPFLMREFRKLWDEQAAEWERLYQRPLSKVDGHQHMHLAANVMFGRLIPPGIKVRRNFSFFPGEKGAANRCYRKWSDGRLAKRHPIADFLFCLQQALSHGRLRRVFRLAAQARVELMTHPIRSDEYEFLMGQEAAELLQGTVTGTYSEL